MAAYEARYSNIQRPLNTVANGVSVAFISNVAKAKLRGLEAELMLMPVSNLTLGFNYSLNDAKYTSWIGSDPYGAVLPGETAGGNIDLSDNPFENAPKHKVNLSASYDIPLSGDNGTVRSEERRLGKEGVRTFKSRWSPFH